MLRLSIWSPVQLHRLNRVALFALHIWMTHDGVPSPLCTYQRLHTHRAPPQPRGGQARATRSSELTVSPVHNSSRLNASIHRACDRRTSRRQRLQVAHLCLGRWSSGPPSHTRETARRPFGSPAATGPRNASGSWRRKAPCQRCHIRAANRVLRTRRCAASDRARSRLPECRRPDGRRRGCSPRASRGRSPPVPYQANVRSDALHRDRPHRSPGRTRCPLCRSPCSSAPDSSVPVLHLHRAAHPFCVRLHCRTWAPALAAPSCAPPQVRLGEDQSCDRAQLGVDRGGRPAAGTPPRRSPGRSAERHSATYSVSRSTNVGVAPGLGRKQPGAEHLVVGQVPPAPVRAAPRRIYHAGTRRRARRLRPDRLAPSLACPCHGPNRPLGPTIPVGQRLLEHHSPPAPLPLYAEKPGSGSHIADLGWATAVSASTIPSAAAPPPHPPASPSAVITSGGQHHRRSFLAPRFRCFTGVSVWFAIATNTTHGFLSPVRGIGGVRRT